MLLLRIGNGKKHETRGLADRDVMAEQPLLSPPRLQIEDYCTEYLLENMSAGTIEYRHVWNRKLQLLPDVHSSTPLGE